MIINIDEKCRRLGISKKAWSAAEDRVDDAISQSWNGERFAFSFEILPEILDKDELVAYIRYNNMHIQYPQFFTWDGVRTRDSTPA